MKEKRKIILLLLLLTISAFTHAEGKSGDANATGMINRVEEYNFMLMPYIKVVGETQKGRLWVGCTFVDKNGTEFDAEAKKSGTFLSFVEKEFEESFRVPTNIVKALFAHERIEFDYIVALWRWKVSKDECKNGKNGEPCKYCMKNGYHLEDRVDIGRSTWPSTASTREDLINGQIEEEIEQADKKSIMGVQLRSVPEIEAKHRYRIDPKLTGALVTAIDTRCDLYMAGLREGDIIWQFYRDDNAQEACNLSSFTVNLLEAHKNGGNYILRVLDNPENKYRDRKGAYSFKTLSISFVSEAENRRIQDENKRKAEEEQQRIEKEKRQKEEEERKRIEEERERNEEKRKQRIEEERKRAEEERQRIEKEKQQKEEEKRKRIEEERQQKEEERKQRIEDERKRAEEERKRKIEEEEKEKAEKERRRKEEEKNKRASASYLLSGITMNDIDDAWREHNGVSPWIKGVFVSDISEKCPLYECGLRSGYLITSVKRGRADKTITCISDLEDALDEFANIDGQILEITCMYKKNGKPDTKTLWHTYR